jgi:hypothetical protein
MGNQINDLSVGGKPFAKHYNYSRQLHTHNIMVVSKQEVDMAEISAFE